MFYSVIIPVYNRPEEVREVLEGLAEQTYPDFEVIVVEDGSTNKADDIVKSFAGQLDVSYYYRQNQGQGFARNYGITRAKGDFLIILDSDTIIPPGYLQAVDDGIDRDQLDAFGGPDRGHDSFNPVQKAADVALTSFLTTGGARGRQHSADRFHPRSFNMGFSREVYKATGGYRLPNLGEDIDLSTRIFRAGFKVGLISEAYVYHKRKDTLKGFWRQMVSFGKTRVGLSRLFPGSLRVIYLLPLVFYAYLLLILLLLLLDSSLGIWMILGLILYTLAIFLEGSIRYRSIQVGLLSIITAFSVFLGYGYGLIKYAFLPQDPAFRPRETSETNI